MCKVLKPYKESEEFTGYKICCLNNKGQYFSLATGTLYKVGKIRGTRTLLKRQFKNSMYENIVNPNSYFYTNKMYGKTGVYVSKEFSVNIYLQALISLKRNLPKNTEVVLLKMTLKGDLHHAGSGGCHQIKTIVGTHITKIERIKG